jgi:hypothetical protein
MTAGPGPRDNNKDTLDWWAIIIGCAIDNELLK